MAVIRTYVKLHNMFMKIPGVSSILMNSTLELPIHKAKWHNDYRICYELDKIISRFSIYCDFDLDKDDFNKFKSCGTLGINIIDIINNQDVASYYNKKILVFKSNKYKIEGYPRRKQYFEVYCKLTEK